MFAVATAVGMFGAMLIVPKLIKRVSYKKLIVVSCILGFVSSFITFFIGYNHFWACIPFVILSCVPCGVINCVSSAMVGDCLDYMELTTGRRQNGLGNACQSFVSKLGNAVSTSVIVLMYILTYTVNPLTMSHGIREGMFSLISIVPGISLLLCMIPMFFYDLTGDKKERVTKELAEKRVKEGIVISE